MSRVGNSLEDRGHIFNCFENKKASIAKDFQKRLRDWQYIHFWSYHVLLYTERQKNLTKEK